MPNINLLPWREALRKEKQQEYLVILAGIALFAFLIIYIISMFYDSALANQSGRNRYLESETRLLEQRIKEIRDLKDARSQLVERMNLIQSLQGKRPVIVRIFDEVARSVPEDLYFMSLQVSDEELNASGLAKSNNRVAALMRNFDESDWFKDPQLIGVQALDSGTNQFEIKVLRSEPQTPSSGVK
ncbi:MAG: PilN domain-containing protein [Oceanobacter sp.]